MPPLCHKNTKQSLYYVNLTTDIKLHEFMLLCCVEIEPTACDVIGEYLYHYAKSCVNDILFFLALSAMLSRVFESSKNLDDVALHHLIEALCKLSNEAMELAYSNRVRKYYAIKIIILLPLSHYVESIQHVFHHESSSSAY
jgi:hypothetical protein